MAGNTSDITIDIRSRFFGKAFTDAQIASKNLNKSIRDMNREIRQSRRDMLIMGTGILFAGMALQRMFGGILKSSTDTFRQITEATWGTSTALTGLAAAGNFLSFTIGDALNTVLEPLMPTIIALVTTIADFVQQHPEVVWAAIAAAVVGMAMVTYGAVMDFIAILTKIPVTTASTIGSIRDGFTGIAALKFDGVLGFLAAIGPAVAVVAALGVGLMIVANGVAQILAAGKEDAEHTAAFNEMQNQMKNIGYTQPEVPMSQTNLFGISGQTQIAIPDTKKMDEFANSTKGALDALEKYLNNGIVPTNKNTVQMSTISLPNAQTGFVNLSSILNKDINPTFVNTAYNADNTTTKLNSQTIAVNNLTIAYKNLATAQSSMGGGFSTSTGLRSSVSNYVIPYVR